MKKISDNVERKETSPTYPRTHVELKSLTAFLYILFVPPTWHSSGAGEKNVSSRWDVCAHRSFNECETMPRWEAKREKFLIFPLLSLFFFWPSQYIAQSHSRASVNWNRFERWICPLDDKIRGFPYLNVFTWISSFRYYHSSILPSQFMLLPRVCFYFIRFFWG